MQVIHCHLHLITTPEKLVFSVKVPVITSKISIINCHIKSITIIVINKIVAANITTPLGGERHCESKVSCPRTQHNVPGHGLNQDSLIQQ